jgi:hypothetical protein
MKFISILTLYFFMAISLFASFLAPAICFVWLIFGGGWVPIALIALAYMMVGGATFVLMLCPGYIFTSLCLSAYVQYAFHDSILGKSAGQLFPHQMMLASLALATLPAMFLGKGDEKNPQVILYNSAVEGAGCVVAWMLFHGELTSYVSILGVYLAGSAVGFSVSWIFAKTSQSEFNVA